MLLACPSYLQGGFSEENEVNNTVAKVTLWVFTLTKWFTCRASSPSCPVLTAQPAVCAPIVSQGNPGPLRIPFRGQLALSLNSVLRNSARFLQGSRLNMKCHTIVLSLCQLRSDYCEVSATLVCAHVRVRPCVRACFSSDAVIKYPERRQFRRESIYFG